MKSLNSLCVSAILAITIGTSATLDAKVCNLKNDFSKKQLRAIERARGIDRVFINRALFGKDVYEVRILHNSSNNTYVTLLGETHIKGPRSHIYGKSLVKRFPVRMVEGLPKQESLYIRDNMPDLNSSLGWQRILMRALTFNFFGSTITAAEKKGYTFLPGYDVMLVNGKKKVKMPTTTTADVVAATKKLGKVEAPLNLPLEVGEFLTPSNGDGYILDKRNDRMASNILEFIDTKIAGNKPLVVVGAAHNPGLESILEEAGYERCEE